MPNQPGYNPEVAQRKPTTRKGQKEQAVDLQHFLALGAQKQPLVELPPAPLSMGSLFPDSAHPLTASTADPQPTYAYQNQATAPGLFNNPGVLNDILTKAGKQATPYNPSDVPDARQSLIEALSAPDPDNPSVPASVRGRASYQLGLGAARADQAEAVTEAQQTLADAQRAERSRAIGNSVAGGGIPGNIKKRTDELTEDEYNAMTPLQRAAVDYNTLLVDAVRKDRNHADDYNPSAKQRKEYQSSVQEMFGSDGGAEGIYAPETVALLKQMGVTDASADLNDYLSLHASIKAKDLENLKPEDLAPSTTATNAENQLFNPEHPLAENRIEFARDMAINTKQMEQSLARSTQLLSSINATVKSEMNNRLALLGGLPNEPKQGAGWDNLYQTDPTATPTDMNSTFIAAFDSLASKKNAGQQGDILAAMQAHYSDSEYKAFLDYIDQRTMNAERFKQPLGTVQGVDYLKPGEMRKLLGFDQGGQ